MLRGSYTGVICTEEGHVLEHGPEGRSGVRAWLPPAEGRAADTIVVGTRDEDNLRGLDVAVSQDKLFFVEV